MPTPLEITIVVWLGALFVCTAIYQLLTQPLQNWMMRWDIFRIVPSYQLFASVPRQLGLSYQTIKRDGWQPILLYSPHRWRHALWHPQHIGPNVLSSLVEHLATERLSETPRPYPIETTNLYRIVERHVAQQIDAKQVRFRITLEGADLYVSNWIVVDDVV